MSTLLINGAFIALLGIALLIVLPVKITFNLRRTRPNEMALALLLSALSPIGQFYVAYKAWESLLGVVAFFLITRFLLGDAMLGFCLATAASVTLMYYRMTYFTRSVQK